MKQLIEKVSDILYDDLLSRWYLNTDDKRKACNEVAKKVIRIVRKSEIELPQERLDILKYI